MTCISFAGCGLVSSIYWHCLLRPAACSEIPSSWSPLYLFPPILSAFTIGPLLIDLNIYTTVAAIDFGDNEIGNDSALKYNVQVKKALPLSAAAFFWAYDGNLSLQPYKIIVFVRIR